MPDFIDPPKDGPIIELYAVICTDETGDGIMAAMVGDTAMPLVTSKRNVALTVMKQVAARAAKLRNKRCKLVRFTTRENIEDIN